jgi:hypothetical protein
MPLSRCRPNHWKPREVDASSRLLADAVGNTGEPTRTPDLRIMRPQPENPNVSKDKDLRQEIKAASHHFLAEGTHSDAGLAAVIEAWNRLPDAVRAGIVAIVKAART